MKELRDYALDLVTSYYLGVMTHIVPPKRDPDALEDLYAIRDATWVSPDVRAYANTIITAHLQPYAHNPGFVYILKGDRYYKIGRTISPHKRLAQISPVLPFEVSMVGLIPAYDHLTAEFELHRLFEASRANGEWFILTDKDILSLESLPVAIFDPEFINGVLEDDRGTQLVKQWMCMFDVGLWTHKMRGWGETAGADDDLCFEGDTP